VRRLHPKVRAYANPFDAKRNPELIDRFLGTESGAHQWRGDWRLKWAKSRGVGGRAKALGLRLQGVLRHWVQRARPA
jgi:hypothetical protein